MIQQSNTLTQNFNKASSSLLAFLAFILKTDSFAHCHSFAASSAHHHSIFWRFLSVRPNCRPSLLIRVQSLSTGYCTALTLLHQLPQIEINILSLKTVRRDEPSLIEEFRREAAYRWAETSGLPPWTTRCTIGC